VAPAFLTRRLDYPTRDAFRRSTTGRVETLRQSAIRYCARRLSVEVAAGRNHTLVKILESDLTIAEDVFTSYLDIPSPGDPRMRFNRGELPIIESTFTWSARDSDTLSRLAPLIEEAERKLTSPRFVSFLSEWGEPAEQAEYFDWVRTVRVCLLVSVVSALDYETVWRTLDGDAGWWLSQRAMALAAWLRVEPAWQSTLDLLEPAASPWRELALHSSALEHLKSLGHVQVAAARWRSLPSSAGLVKHLGVRVPADFFAMPSSPFARGGPACFARTKVWHRLALIRQFWEYSRSQMKANAGRLEFAFVAASLHHGGRHPPHAEHRDGAEVDVDLACLPDLVDHTNATVRIDIESGDYEILDGYDEPAAPGEEFLKVPGDWTFPTNEDEWRPMARKFEGCGYPNVPRTSDVELWNRAARKFTQCIYLTFPGSIIYASQGIAIDARDSLSQRAATLLQREAARGNAGAAHVEVLRIVVALLEGIRPVVWLNKPDEIAAKIRYGHRNHWHVNFNPDRLGDEGAFASDHRLDRLIDEAITGLLTLGLWQDLLQD